jgi:hypothetical protein
MSAGAPKNIRRVGSCFSREEHSVRHANGAGCGLTY